MIPKINPEHKRKDGTPLSQAKERRRFMRTRRTAWTPEHRTLRDRVRFHCWNRENYRCRKCGRPVALKSDSLFELAHIHEIKSRGQGGSDLDTTNCVCLCYSCHLYGQHHQTADTQYWFEIVVVDIILGADNPDGLKFVPWEANAS